MEETDEKPEKPTGAELKAEDVLNALDELDEAELKRFKWYLQQPEILPGLPAIKKKFLEQTESLDVVELMTQTYTLELCKEVMTTIFMKIRRNDLMQGLARRVSSENRMYQLNSLVRNTTNPRNTDNVQDMIEKIQNEIQKIEKVIETSKDALDKEKEEGVLVITALKETAEKVLNEVIQLMEDKQKTTKNEAEDFIKDLKQEISELMNMSSEDSLREDLPNKEWVEDRVHPPSYEGTVERAVAQMRETLWVDMEKRIKLKRVQQYAVDVTLDPDTAHPHLIISDDRKQVRLGDFWQKLPDYPKRFTLFTNVLGEQSFSSGKFYFEVQVRGKTDWDLGVVKESVEREGETSLNAECGFWSFVLRNENQYSTGDDTLARFNLHPGPEKVGVFVDYEEGLVSFYDVDSASLIYSFTHCCFKEKLYPYLSPFLNEEGKNSAPLIISPVNKMNL